MATPRIKKTSVSSQLFSSEQSDFAAYRYKVYGDIGVLDLIYIEMVNTLFSNLAGSPGYLLRRWMYKRTFKRCGRKVVIGKGITLRHPGRVSLGDRVAIDDYTLIDASGDPDQGIVIGDDVVVSRNCVIQAKCGPVVLGRRTDIGCNTIVTSISGIELGDAVLIAGHCYLGGGRYTTAVTDAPIMDQDFESRGRLVVGDGAWLGAGVTVLDGIRVGRGCVVGAGAVVTKDLPDYAIAVGVPARVIGMREGCEVGGDTTPRQPILA